VNLNSEKEVNNFLNKAIYDEAVFVRLSFRNICTDLIVTQHMPVQEGTPLIYIEEILFNSKNDAIARCKFYFLPNEFDIVITTANPFESRKPQASGLPVSTPGVGVSPASGTYRFIGILTVSLFYIQRL
jgi:hypothetical protein